MDMPLGKGKTLLIIQIICLAIAWVAVSIRLYTRTRILDGNRWEDYLMYAALVRLADYRRNISTGFVNNVNVGSIQRAKCICNIRRSLRRHRPLSFKLKCYSDQHCT